MTRLSNSRKLTILAQDPAVRLGGRLAFASVDVPAEILAKGPTGYRVKIVDYDASSRLLYQDLTSHDPVDGEYPDPFARLPEEEDEAYEARLLANPNFHSQNVYAIVMRTLARFEFALGRRVPWSFGGHQLNVAPHAFAEANAFYSEEDKGLFFGYFDGNTSRVFTCLSHDVVAHETTHALLDGLRSGFTELSGPDQAGFHEAFADVVALLSIFSLPEIVAALLDEEFRPARQGGKIRLIDARRVEAKALRETSLLALAEQFGREVQDAHGDALRRSVMIEPDPDVLSRMEYQEEHARGEVLAAAMMRAFLDLWGRRISELGTFEGQYNLDMVIEEGAKVANHLLTMSIRALDYCPTVDIDFPAFLAAALTGDAELVPDDRYGYREVLRNSFAAYGIMPPEEGCRVPDGTWCPFEPDPAKPVNYANTHFESMLRDKEEVFRFIWENRTALGIEVQGVIEVDLPRPSVRQGPDGFFLKETVVPYIQRAELFGSEVLTYLGCERPDGMPTTRRIEAFGGGVLIFDQYGQIKYHIAHPLKAAKRQSARLQYLWDTGQTIAGRRGARDRFAGLHRARAED